MSVILQQLPDNSYMSAVMLFKCNDSSELVQVFTFVIFFPKNVVFKAPRINNSLVKRILLRHKYTLFCYQC